MTRLPSICSPPALGWMENFWYNICPKIRPNLSKPSNLRLVLPRWSMIFLSTPNHYTSVWLRWRFRAPKNCPQNHLRLSRILTLDHRELWLRSFSKIGPPFCLLSRLFDEYNQYCHARSVAAVRGTVTTAIHQASLATEMVPLSSTCTSWVEKKPFDV